MKVLHVINKQSEDGLGLRNLSKSDSEKDVYFSGYWDISYVKALNLVGGMLFLHETKAKPSRFGGVVISVGQVQKDEFAREQRVIFKFKAMREARGVRWRGANHAMTGYGNIIEVND